MLGSKVVKIEIQLKKYIYSFIIKKLINYISKKIYNY